MTRLSLRCPRVEGNLEGREGGLIEFEVGEAVEVEDEAFKVERAIEVWKGIRGRAECQS